MQDRIIKLIQASIDTKQQILQDHALMTNLERAVEHVLTCFRSGGKVLLCGNGGSAADAQHIAAEFTGRFYADRAPLPAEALHVNSSYMTAVGNDYGFEMAYARLVEAFAKHGDILIPLSTSGNSPNIIRAIDAAKTAGMQVIGFSGQGGGAMKERCDILLNVPSTDTPRIQESHILLGHILCQLVEEKYFAV
jgi:D-sedoheptulose 7-phosphate isomerase